MDEAQQQQMYDKRWADLLAWAQDKSSKHCSDDGFAGEWGLKLEQIAESPLGRSVLKGVFARGWRATLPIREEQADRIATLETQLAAANDKIRELDEQLNGFGLTSKVRDLNDQLKETNEAVRVLELLVRTGGRVSFVQESPFCYVYPYGISVSFMMKGCLHSYTRPTLSEAIKEVVSVINREQIEKIDTNYGISVSFIDSQGRSHSYTKPTLAEVITQVGKQMVEAESKK